MKFGDIIRYLREHRGELLRAWNAHFGIDVGDLRADAVEFTATELVVTLADGRKIATPLDWYPRLKRASAQQRANFEIMAMGIHWPDLDEVLASPGC
jgi:hypothetical protein